MDWSGTLQPLFAGNGDDLPRRGHFDLPTCEEPIPQDGACEFTGEALVELGIVEVVFENLEAVPEGTNLFGQPSVPHP